MADELQYNEAGFQVDAEGELVLDDKDQPIPKPEDETEEEKTARLEKEKGEQGETDAEKVARLEKESAGLKYDIGEQRTRRREAEDALASERTKPALSKEEQDLRDAETVTRGDLKEERAKIKQEVRDEVKKGKAEDLKIKDEGDLKAARASKEGFAEIEKMANEVLDANPELNASYKIAPDLVAFYGKIAKLHASYESRIKQAARSDVVKGIKKSNERVPTAAGGGKGGTGGSGEDFEEMTLEDYDKLTPKQREAVPESVKERLLGGSED